MKNSVLRMKKYSISAVIAILIIAAISFIGVSNSTALADDPDPYMYVNWPTQGSECDLYLDSGETGPLAGWCANKDIYIYIGTHYAYTLYDYYADYYPDNLDALPAHIQSKDWNRITYIMNHVVEGASAQDIQEAVWYYTDGFVSIRANSVTMRIAAEANGDGYVPPSDGWTPVIVDMGPNVQVQFYMVTSSEAEAPLPEMPPVLLFTTGILGIGGFMWYRKRHTATA